MHFLPQWMLSLSHKHEFIRERYSFCVLSSFLFTIFVPFLIEIVVPPLVYSEQSVVVVATYEGVINPVSSEYLHDAIEFAETEFHKKVAEDIDNMATLIRDLKMTGIDVSGAVELITETKKMLLLK